MPVVGVQTGELVLTANTANVTITAVDLAKSYLRITWRSDSTDGFREVGVNARLTSTTNIAFQVGNNGTSTTTIKWTVVEFDDSDFNVQRGDVTGGYDNTNVTISAVVLARSTPTASLAFNSSTFTARAIVAATITTTTNLNLQKTATSNTRTSWQVIEWPTTFDVQAGTITVTGTTNDATITSVTLAQTALWQTARLTGNIADKDTWMYRGTITTTTNVNAERFADTFDDLVMVFHALEMPSGNSVQTGEVSFGTGDTSLTATITAIDTSRSNAWARSAMQTAGQAEDIAANPDVLIFQIDFLDTTTLRIRRNSTGEDLDVPWQVVEYAGAEGAIVGSAAGTTTAVGTLIGRGKMVASAAGATVAAGVLIGVGFMVASAAGSTVADGALIGIGQMSATAAGSTVGAGNVLGRGQMVGSAAGSTVAAGVLTAKGFVVGNAAGSTTAGGVLIGRGFVVGDAAGSTVAAGALIGVGQMVASAAGSTTAAGALTGIGQMVGSSAGSTVGAGNILGRGQMVASAAGSTTAAGVLIGRGFMVASAAGSTTAGGVLIGRGFIVGNADGSTLAEGQLDAGDVTGTAAGTTTAVGTLIGHGFMSAAAAGTTTGVGVLVGRGKLSANAAGTTIAVGALIGHGFMSGNAAGSTTAVGALTVPAAEFGLVVVFDVGLEKVFVQDVGKL